MKKSIRNIYIDPTALRLGGIIFHYFPDFLKNDDRNDIILFNYLVSEGNKFYYLPCMSIACITLPPRMISWFPETLLQCLKNTCIQKLLNNQRDLYLQYIFVVFKATQII